MGSSLPVAQAGDDVSPADRQAIQSHIAAFQETQNLGKRPSVDVFQPYPIVPIGGNLWDDLFVNNYVDLDPTTGIMDWDCTDWTYDGHRGHDIDLRGFP